MNICSEPSDSSLDDAVRLHHDTHYILVLTSSYNVSLLRVCVNEGVRMNGWMNGRINVWMYVDCCHMTVQVLHVCSHIVNVHQTVCILR